MFKKHSYEGSLLPEGSTSGNTVIASPVVLPVQLGSAPAGNIGIVDLHIQPDGGL